MEIIEKTFWVFYVSGTSSFEKEKVGKWMYFFDDKSFAASICKEAIEKNVVVKAKHSNEEKGVACFYLNCDDMEAHKKVIAILFNVILFVRQKKESIIIFLLS